MNKALVIEVHRDAYDVVEAIEPTEDGVWSETFSVTDNEDLTIRLDEGEDFYATAL